MRLRVLLSAVLALAASAVLAQVPPDTGSVFIPIVSSYDYDSVTQTYCLMGPSIQGLGTVSTSGSSQQLDASRTTSFTSTVTAEGELTIRAPGAASPTTAIVNSVADGDTLTMRAAATITAGSEWSYRNIACGTAVGSGWFQVGNITPSRTWALTVSQISLASGSMAVKLWCKTESPWETTGTQVYPETGAAGSECATGLFTAVASCKIVDNDIRLKMCRWGVTLTDDAGDLTTNREQVTIAVTGSQQ